VFSRNTSVISQGMISVYKYIHSCIQFMQFGPEAVHAYVQTSHWA